MFPETLLVGMSIEKAFIDTEIWRCVFLGLRNDFSYYIISHMLIWLVSLSYPCFSLENISCNC